MLQVIVAGNLGADAEVRGEQGREFTTFRVAHTDRWTGQDGVSHETTTWVDCILNGRPNVVPYLRKGTQVVVIGTASLRVYSSPRDRCMKAGMQVSVRTVELLEVSQTQCQHAFMTPKVSCTMCKSCTTRTSHTLP